MNFKGLITYLLAIVGFAAQVWGQAYTVSEDVCNSNKHWTGYLWNYNTGEVYETFYPSEFFTENGATLPGYEPSYANPSRSDTTCSDTIPMYEFVDKSLMTDDFEFTFTSTFTSNGYGYMQVSLGVNGPDKDDFSFLDGLRSGQATEMRKGKGLSIDIPMGQSGMRSTTYSVSKFVAKDGIIYIYSNGRLNRTVPYEPCFIDGFYVTWFCGTGSLESVEFIDHTNGTTYYEDFSDCHNTQLFPKAPEPEPTYINITYDAPTCNDRYLTLKAESNLESITWAGAEGFKMVGNEIRVPYDKIEEAGMECFVAYGKRDRCSPVEHQKICPVYPELPPNKIEEDLELCFEDSLALGDQVVNSSGKYSKVIRGDDGCDVTKIYNVTYHEMRKEIQEEKFVCDPWIVDTDTTGKSGNGSLLYNDTSEVVTTIAGECPLHLLTPEIHKRPAITVIDTFYRGDQSVQIGEYTYNSEGIFYIQKETVDGCDSVILVVVKGKEPIDKVVEKEVCFGGKFVSDSGREYTAEGEYKEVFKSVDGWDSTMIYRLTFLPISEETAETKYLCYDPEKEDKPAIYLETLETENEKGCQHFVYTPVDFKPVARGEVTVLQCYGEAYERGGMRYDSEGDFETTLMAANGCDSILTTHLKFKPKAERWNEPIYECGDVESEIRSIAETTETGEDGCKVYVYTETITKPISKSVVEMSACEGEEIIYEDVVYANEGNYTVRLTAANGCDSVVTLKLKHTPLARKTVGVELCYGETLATDRGEYAESGVYTEVIGREGKCDSVVTYMLTIRELSEETLPMVTECREAVDGIVPPDEIGVLVTENEYGCTHYIYTPYHYESPVRREEDVTVCWGQTYSVGGRTLDEAGDYITTLSAANGCDSIIETHLVIREKAEMWKEREEVCSDTEIGKEWYETEMGVDENGCDLYIYTPKVNIPIKHTYIDTTICEGESVSIDGIIYNAEGNYVTTTTAANGCDSIVNLRLSVTPLARETVSETLCYGEVLRTEKGVYDESGTYTEVIEREGKCDSVVTYHLTIRELSEETRPTEVICQEPINGTLPADGIRQEITENEFGCTHYIFTPYHYESPVREEETVTVCWGETYTIGGKVLETDGDYVTTLTAANGCDSVITTHFKVREKDEQWKDTMRICAESEIGKTWVETETRTNMWGCPTFIYTPKINIPTSRKEIDTTICQGQRVRVGGKYFGENGTHNIYMTAANGCDSIVTLNLRVRESETETKFVTLCYGETYQGDLKEYDKSGDYTEYLTTAEGCDSVVNLRIKVLGRQTERLPGVTFCGNDTLHYHGAIYTDSGEHIDTVMAENGCPLYRYTKIIATEGFETEDREYEVCRGERTFVQAGVGLTQMKFQWSPETYLEETDKACTYSKPESDIVYTVRLTKGACEAEEKISVRVKDVPEIKSITVNEDLECADVRIEGGYAPYYIMCDDHNAEISGRTIKFDAPGTYMVTVTDGGGCTDSLSFFYKYPIKPAPWFTPGSGDEHDLWTVKGIEKYHHFEIMIFDRWGKILKKYVNSFEGWDGTYNGVKQPSTDYWYSISVDLGEFKIAGHFTLVRFDM